MSSKTYPQFLLLGDSLVQYSTHLKDGFSFGAALEEHCQRRLDIINRGLSGYNTANELVVLPDLIPPTTYVKVDYALILFGANDSCLPSSPTGQHVPLENYRENLKKIITEPALIAHKPNILLVTPPPIHETHLESEDVQKGRGRLSRHQSFTAQYADVVRQLAAELTDHNVVLVDLHKAMIDEAIRLTPDFVAGKGLIGSKDAGESSGLRTLLVDGLHFTGAGYKVFFDIVVPHIGPQWAKESPIAPSWPFPHWTVAPRLDR